MFRFESSSYLLLLLVLPLIVALYVWGRVRWSKMMSRVPGPMQKLLFGQFSKSRSLLKMILSVSALGFFVLALARPQMGKGQSTINSEGVELMLLIDVSKSMMAEDVRPSRLDHAKKEMIRLLDQLSGDKVGLVAFAGSSVLLSPMTTDASALKMFIESLSVDSVQTQGTEVGEALQEAAEAFERGERETDEPNTATKVIVLISDGEDHEKGAEKMAADLTKKGIRLFTMAFGTEAGARVPLRDSRGRLRGYLKDKSGQEIKSQVKGDFLRQLASQGKGSFYHVTFGGNQMKALLEDIDGLEKSEFDSILAENYDEKFQWFLFLGFLLALVEWLLSPRSGSTVNTTSRRGVSS